MINKMKLNRFFYLSFPDMLPMTILKAVRREMKTRAGSMEAWISIDMISNNAKSTMGPTNKPRNSIAAC